MLIQHDSCKAGAISSQVSEIKAGRERDNGNIRKYATVASEQPNAESGKKAESGGFGLYDQVTKRTWWMPWRQKAMKDV